MSMTIRAFIWGVMLLFVLGGVDTEPHRCLMPGGKAVPCHEAAGHAKASDVDQCCMKSACLKCGPGFFLTEFFAWTGEKVPPPALPSSLQSLPSGPTYSLERPPKVA